MRRRLVVAAWLLATPSLALADVEPAPGQCVEYTPACGGCAREVCSPPAQDMSIRYDLSRPRDLAPPSDGALDACRERARRHHRAQGRGLVLLSGLSAVLVVALRRRRA
ncbi:MAG TPA: hypothetical protein VF334_24290 [Polyangia bacterium]